MTTRTHYIKLNSQKGACTHCRPYFCNSDPFPSPTERTCTIGLSTLTLFAQQKTRLPAPKCSVLPCSTTITQELRFNAWCSRTSIQSVIWTIATCRRRNRGRCTQSCARSMVVHEAGREYSYHECESKRSKTLTASSQSFWARLRLKKMGQSLLVQMTSCAREPWQR